VTVVYEVRFPAGDDDTSLPATELALLLATSPETVFNVACTSVVTTAAPNLSQEVYDFYLPLNFLTDVSVNVRYVFPGYVPVRYQCPAEGGLGEDPMQGAVQAAVGSAGGVPMEQVLTECPRYWLSFETFLPTIPDRVFSLAEAQWPECQRQYVNAMAQDTLLPLLQQALQAELSGSGEQILLNPLTTADGKNVMQVPNI
jgi:hypothetical protein